MKIPDLKGLDILLMEADSMYAATLSSGLSELGAGVVVASSAEQAAGLLAGGRYTAVISSLDLIDERSIGMLADFKRAHPHALCFLLAEHDYDSVEASHDSVRTIVDDYLKKPVDVRRLARMIQTSLGMPSTGSTSLAVVEPLISRVKPYFLFRSPVMQHALAKLPEIAASGQTVLVTGETGTGKEIVARAIHMLSPRSSGPFVPINCGAIPESLIEGELFGHEKGAFTGAHRSRKGKFESADGGTLFLDEIADMPPDLQGRLLRVLEEGRVYRVGGERAIPIDVRVIAATRVALEKAVDGGLFRDDLFYRLNVLRINLPPLRERTEDIPLLAAHFLERALVSMGRTSPFPILSSETIHLLEHYPWRGNVRELRNIMARVATLLPPDTRRIFPIHILPHLDTPNHIHRTEQKGEQTGIMVPFGANMAQIEDIVIAETLKITGGNRSKTASILGLSIRTLRRRLNKKPDK